MRVLILSLDQTLIGRGEEGDTLKRLLSYSRSCHYLGVIVPTIHKRGSYKKGKVEILPAFGKNKLSAFWRNCWLTKESIKKNHVDLVVTNDAVLGAIGVWWRYFYPIKVQIDIFGLEIIHPKWLKERAQNFLLKLLQEWAIKRADGFRTDSHKAKKLLIKHYKRDTNKIVVIPVAPSRVTQERFLSATKNQRLRKRLLGEKKKLILSVGSLVKAKDLPTLLKAAKLVVKKYPETIFVIAGEGPERRKLERMINKFGLEDTVRLVGSIAYAKLPELYASADLFVLSSSHEGFPRVLMEAALTRLPIVTTCIEGASELVENQKSGLLVPIASSQKLAEAMIDLLEHPKKGQEMAAVAQKNARKLLDFDRVVKRVVTSWKGLVR